MKLSARLAAAVAAIVLTNPLGAAPPRISYQGIVLDGAGKPLTGPVDLQFDLFSSATDPTSLWSETHAAVSLVDGVYSVELGASTPFDAALLAGSERWLEVRVNGETLAPRQRLLSVPYALRAQEVDALVTPGLEGLPCRQGTPLIGTLQVSYGNLGTVSGLTCVPSNSYTLSVTVVQPGGIPLPVTGPGILCISDVPDCSETYPAGTSVQLLREAAAPGVEFEWSGDCSTSTTTTCNVFMDGPKSVTATYTRP